MQSEVKLTLLQFKYGSSRDCPSDRKYHGANQGYLDDGDANG
jgi:hypothetical protein